MSEQSGNLEQLAAQLKALSDLIPMEEVPTLSSRRLTTVRRTVGEVYDKLGKLIESLDPIKHPSFVFDPANPNVVGRIVGMTMIAQDRKPLATIERFYGSGVYAIYYHGDFPAYAAISSREHPIYVGKADPASAASKTPVDQGDRLSSRLNEHRKNIAKAASTLRLDDFEYRALVVQTGWQTSAEDYLIHLFKPIWNSEMDICYGFGKHGDDPKTRANLRSPWDTLHPGRDWAHRDPAMKDARPAERIVDDVAQHLASNVPFESVDGILKLFLREMQKPS